MCVYTYNINIQKDQCKALKIIYILKYIKSYLKAEKCYNIEQPKSYSFEKCVLTHSCFY